MGDLVVFIAVQERVLRFFAEAARRMKNKPNFYGWDLWSEPHVINWAEIQQIGNLEYVQFCYCPSSIARFRRWPVFRGCSGGHW